jgi:hypothetical protein
MMPRGACRLGAVLLIVGGLGACDLARAVTLAPAPAAAPARDTLAAAGAADPADSTFESPEPPEETAPGVDYVEDRETNLPPGEIETSWGYSGRGTSNIRRRQRVRVREGAFEAGVREGRADALPGAMARANLGSARVMLGSAPHAWGQSLLVGAPSEPWLANGIAGAAARSGVGARDGAEYERGDDVRLRVAALHAVQSSFAGLSLDRLGTGAGALVQREAGTSAPRVSASLWTARGPAAGEVAFDGRGRWRTQTVWRAIDTPTHLALGARFGETGFRSASVSRAGPASALSAALDRRAGPLTCEGLGALWRFRGTRTGARAALELRALLPQHDVVALGAEERHGVRVDSEREAQAAPPFRQRVWAGWSGGPPDLAMSLKHEIWGSRGGLHAIRRSVTTAAFTASPSRGFTIGVTHTLYRTETGDTQYIGEQEDDRQVLRALSGTGRRTRFEAGIPAAGGAVHAALMVTAAVHPSAPAWTIDWTRRARRT